MSLPQYYFCGCCNSYHRNNFNGDCRNDAERFDSDQLNQLHGSFGWEEVDMFPVNEKE